MSDWKHRYIRLNLKLLLVERNLQKQQVLLNFGSGLKYLFVGPEVTALADGVITYDNPSSAAGLDDGVRWLPK